MPQQTLLAALAPSEWAVIVAGVAAIAWVNWYFFLARKAEGQAAPGNAAIQEATVVVQGGYDPQVVRVRAGVPLRLTFDRRETNSCSDEIVLADFNVRRRLAANARTAIEIMPQHPGTYEFTCGMNMLRGRIIAE